MEIGQTIPCYAVLEKQKNLHCDALSNIGLNSVSDTNFHTISPKSLTEDCNIDYVSFSINFIHICTIRH